MYLILGLIILACLILWAVILIQNPKGGGLSSNFGGGNVTSLIGAKQSVDFVEKATWVVSSVILVLVLVSTMALPTGSSSSYEPKVKDAIENTGAVPAEQNLSDQINPEDFLPQDGDESGELPSGGELNLENGDPDDK